MADNSSKVLQNTHHQFLTVPQELDEDSWISGEELFTEGSSDDESKNLTIKPSCKKTKNTVNRNRRFSLPKYGGLSTEIDEEEDSDDGGASAGVVKLPGGHNRRSVESLEWRPKRGSLKFSDLLATPDDESVDFNSEDLEFLQRPLINVMEYLGDSERTEKIQSIRLNIQDLEKRFTETENILQNERRERLQNQKVMEDYAAAAAASDEFLFENVNSATIEPGEDSEKGKSTKSQEENSVFIKRNIELAAKAMTKLPFTDEEKEKLEHILSETGDDEEQADEKSASSVDVEDQTRVNFHGYQISKTERERIAEINAKLQEFDGNSECDEAASSTSLSNIDGISFWDNIVLDQALKNVNAKLAELESKNKPNCE